MSDKRTPDLIFLGKEKAKQDDSLSVAPPPVSLPRTASPAFLRYSTVATDHSWERISLFRKHSLCVGGRNTHRRIAGAKGKSQARGSLPHFAPPSFPYLERCRLPGYVPTLQLRRKRSLVGRNITFGKHLRVGRTPSPKFMEEKDQSKMSPPSRAP